MRSAVNKHITIATGKRYDNGPNTESSEYGNFCHYLKTPLITSVRKYVICF